MYRVGLPPHNAGADSNIQEKRCTTTRMAMGDNGGDVGCLSAGKA